MTKGQDLSRYQKGIVRRHYEHYDTKTITALATLVSDIALATEPKAKDKLWKRAADWLAKVGVEPAKITAIVAAQRVEAIAQIVSDLEKGKSPKA